MLIEGLTMEQALRTNYELLGRRYGEKAFISFIEHRRSRGWVINERNGVYKVVGIFPVS